MIEDGSYRAKCYKSLSETPGFSGLRAQLAGQDEENNSEHGRNEERGVNMATRPASGWTSDDRSIIRGSPSFDLLSLITLAVLLVAGEVPASEAVKRSYIGERIAVLGFDGSQEVDKQVVNYIDSRMRAQVAALERFLLVNRRNSEIVLREFGISAKVNINSDQAREVAHWLSAQKLLAGNVNYCKTKEEYSGGPGIDRYNEISVTLKIFNVQMGRYSKAVDVRNFDIIARAFSETEAIDSAVDQIIVKLCEAYSLVGRIINTGVNSVVINMGMPDGIRAGMLFTVYRITEEHVGPLATSDPDRKGMTEVGLVKIRSVSHESSKASILRGRYRIEAGYEVEECPRYNFWEHDLLINYSSIPVNFQKNPSFDAGDIGRARYYGLGYALKRFDKSLALEAQVGRLDIDPIHGWEARIFAKYRMPMLPDFLSVHVGGGMGLAGASYELPNADKVFSSLEIDSRSGRINDRIFGLLGSLNVEAEVASWFCPFVNLTWRDYGTMNEWAVEHRTGEFYDSPEGDQREKTEKVNIPKRFLPYPSLNVDGLAFRFGLNLHLDRIFLYFRGLL